LLRDDRKTDCRKANLAEVDGCEIFEEAMSQHSRHKDDGAQGVNLGAIITPMLDMSFQILSFFIMTYHPSALEGHINGNLVPPANPLIKGKEKNTPTEQPLLADSDPDLEDTLSVIVKAIPKGGMERGRSDGQPAQMYIKKKEDTDLTLVADTDETIPDSYKKLKARLKASVGGGTMQNNIRLDCQGDLKHKYVMELYDVCKSSGFKNVSFVAPVAGQKKE
jgi:biopolymer transport protein ExbD